jgi:hypothetical protein
MMLKIAAGTLTDDRLEETFSKVMENLLETLLRKSCSSSILERSPGGFSTTSEPKFGAAIEDDIKINFAIFISI